MASRRRPRRRDSMDPPPNISDVTHLNEELNRLHKDISPECKKHFNKINDLLNDFTKDQLDIYALKGGQITGAIGMMFAVLSFLLDDDDVSFMFALAAAVMAVVAVLCVAFGLFKTTQKKKNLKRSVKEELQLFQDKMNPTIDMMEQICQRIEEILNDPLLLDYKFQALSDHFTHSFRKKPIFQSDFGNVDDLKWSKVQDLPGKLLEMIAKVNSVPDILQEIIGENKRRKDKPAKKLQIEFKEKADKFINDMQKEICQFKKLLKEINQISDKISNLFN